MLKIVMAKPIRDLRPSAGKLVGLKAGDILWAGSGKTKKPYYISEITSEKAKSSCGLEWSLGTGKQIVKLINASTSTGPKMTLREALDMFGDNPFKMVIRTKDVLPYLENGLATLLKGHDLRNFEWLYIPKGTMDNRYTDCHFRTGDVPQVDHTVGLSFKKEAKLSKVLVTIVGVC